MRTWTEIVKPYPRLIAGKYYKVRVKNIRKIAKPRRLVIDLEFMDAPQQGRRLELFLALPIRPDSLAASFFKACHMTVMPEAKIAPRNTVNALIAVSFEAADDGRDFQPVGFQTITEGDHRESIQL